MKWERYAGLFELPPTRPSVPVISSTWLIRALKGVIVAVTLSSCGPDINAVTVVTLPANAGAPDAGICHGRHGRCG